MCVMCVSFALMCTLPFFLIKMRHALASAEMFIECKKAERVNIHRCQN